MNYIYSNSYLECYKKHNSFELNKNVTLKIFDSNVRVLFREAYIQFGYKQRETFFKTVFFQNIKTESNSLDSWSIISEFINGNKNAKIVFSF